MERTDGPGVPLTAFDRRTATAVVAVLCRAGVDAWAAATDGEDVEVRVVHDQRDHALRELGNRMEEVREAVLAADADPLAQTASETPPAAYGDDPPNASGRGAAPPPDPDDVRAGPPLVMERFRSIRFLAVAVMAPLLVVTLAPTLRGTTGRLVVGVLMAVVVVALLVTRRRR